MFASNTGAKLAKGSYIARMDADDWSFPERLQLQSEFLDKNPDFGAVSGLVEYVPHHDNTQGFARYVEWINSVKTWDEISTKRFIEAPVVNPTAMWRKEVGKLYGLYKKGDFPEDYEMWLRWLQNGVKINKLNTKVLKWYDSDTRLTRTHEIYSDKAFFKIKTQYLALWLKKHNAFHPGVAVWGASKISRQRALLLGDYGLEIQFYIDIKKTRQLSKNVVYFEDLPKPGSIFILVYMKHVEIRSQIEDFLKYRGYVEGINYLLVS